MKYVKYMSDIYQYIKSEETNYQTTPITVIEGYDWSMFKHCKLTTLYINSVYETGNSDDKPYKNIILDKINLQHRAIEFDVKDVQVFVDNPENYYKSLLTRKYHTRWARQNNMGKFFNDLADTFTDFGGVLVKNVNDVKPEIVPFHKIAFCDQTDIISGAICIKHFYTPSQMKGQKGWIKEEVQRAISIALEKGSSYKETAQTKQQNSTPTPYIEVYELHGEFENEWLLDHYSEDENLASDLKGDEYSRQMHIVAFYKDEKNNDCGITLYRGREYENPFKLALRDEIPGRGLGRGGVEELFEAQVWTNYNEIRQKELLDQASKIVYQTADKGFTTRNKTNNLQQGQILVYNDSPLQQVNTQSVNFPLFINKSNAWDEHAKTIAGAGDMISGANQAISGVPFRLGMMLNQEAHSLHKYRKQKLALFVQELYRDWILKFLVEKMKNKQTFMDVLSLEDMDQLANNVAVNEANKYIKDKMWNLEVIDPAVVEKLKETEFNNFKAKGDKRFFRILQNELTGLPIDVDVTITGEQKNNAFVAEKLSSIFGQIAQNPTILENPDMRRLFNEILEVSDLSPIQYSSVKPTMKQVNNIASPVASPPQDLANINADGDTAQP